MIATCTTCYRYHRALLYIAHDVTMHMGRQQELAKVLTENGIVVFGHDHGKCNVMLWQQFAQNTMILFNLWALSYKK